jgi:hypothetical protein
MPWAYIRSLLGPGLHWDRTQSQLLAAIAQADKDGQPDAADHIRIILRLRNRVLMDVEQKETPPERG